MTVIDIAPVDQDTGLPVPTIAVFTDGGVSVIDGVAGVGTVVDQVYTGYTMRNGDITNGRIIWETPQGGVIFSADITKYAADFTNASIGADETNYNGTAYYNQPGGGFTTPAPTPSLT